MTAVLVAIGSNLGDRMGHVMYALDSLARLGNSQLTEVSTLYETAPVGGSDSQGRFLNAVLSLTTKLDPGTLLASLHAIEAKRLRERKSRWEARTLDLDLLTYGDEIIDDPQLMLPHPRMHERRFVMVPVCDVAAETVHPRLGATMAALLKALPDELGDVRPFDKNWAQTALVKKD